jgi:hypothetical protein
MIDKLRAYAGKYLAPQAQGDTNMAIAAIQYRIKVRTTRLPDIDAWLANTSKRAAKRQKNQRHRVMMLVVKRSKAWGCSRSGG